MQVTDRSFPSYLHRKFPYFDVCLPGSAILWWRFSKNSWHHLLDAFFEVFWSLSFDESSDFVTSTTSFSEYNFFPPNTIRSGGSFSRFSSFFALRFLASVTKAKRVFNLRISASTLRSYSSRFTIILLNKMILNPLTFDWHFGYGLIHFFVFI